jgi:DNA-binding NtrC family response regulator
MLDVGTVLIVESDNKNRDIAFASAVKHGEIPIARFSCGEARTLLEKRRFKVVFCSDSLPDGEYAEVIRAARPTPVIVLSRSADWDSYLAALQVGAFDYIACPPYQAEVDRILSFALNSHSQPLKQRSSAA